AVNGVAADISAGGDFAYARTSGGSRIVLLDSHGQVSGSSSEEGRFDSPRMSPDGQRVVVTKRGDRPSESDGWIYNVGSSGLQRLTSDGLSGSPLSWSPDGQRVLFNRRRGGVSGDTWWLPPDRSAPAEALVSLPGRIGRTVISPDMRYAVFSVTALPESKTKS